MRATATTKTNVQSSRSHLLVQFYLYNVDGKRLSKLILVDLAGSECLKQSGEKEERIKEAKSINLSLFELTNVLRDLQNPKSMPSFRNSVLTLMLKDSLGGKTKNIILIHLNPTVHDYASEPVSLLILRASLSSLQLGEKISSIKLGSVFSQSTDRLENKTYGNSW